VTIGWLLLLLPALLAADIERFEHLDTRNGLSQNSVLSIYCDHRGLMWFGTMDGLNCYNGYTFKIYKAVPGEKNVLTNNRIVSITEDPHHFLWVKTHDGYLHYLDERVDRFTTFPYYQESEEEQNSEIRCFYQAGDDEIWLGGSNSGVYRLRYNEERGDYDREHFLNRGLSHITNNSIRFITRDQKGTIWIGTRQGLNKLEAADNEAGSFSFQHFFVDIRFTSAVVLDDRICFGTEGRGVITYNTESGAFSFLDLLPLADGLAVNLLQRSQDGTLIVGTEGGGLILYDPSTGGVKTYLSNDPVIRRVFEDNYGDLWITTGRFGITRLEKRSGRIMYFTLTPTQIVDLVDNERQFIFEDSKKQLWIGLHGAGLALFKRETGNFVFYRNDPDNLNSINSNFVHCIAEDKSGLLWVGTGQFNGGVNKVIFANPAFRQVILKQKIDDKAENVVRSLLQDSNGYIWAATKSGAVHILDTLFNERFLMNKLPILNESLQGFNVYTMLQDQDGYIWLGSKGGGITVSTLPLSEYKGDYSRIRFHHFMAEPDKPEALSSNFIYSILQDKGGAIWIGTYGGGLLEVQSREHDKLVVRRMDQSNTNISSNEVRQVFIDSQDRLWAATTFGLDLLIRDRENDSLLFSSFNYNPLDTASISYNDIIHIFEDTRRHLWFGTFGGGVNQATSITADSVRFMHFNRSSGLINDAVFGILEDRAGYIWFSTENGISRFNPNNQFFDNYDKNNGLLSSNFLENTCLLMHDGRLLFGTINGILVISPDRLKRSDFTPPIILTNFQLNNRELDIRDEQSPVKANIEFLDEVELAYNQNSFSIEYAALSYLDPSKNKYSFLLENFEEVWNEVGNQRKATYTNISPGTYIFRVKAANWDGTWNSIPRSLVIKILPPWYRARLAYFIYFLFFLVLMEIARRIFTKYNLMRNDLKVERRVNEIKLQFFTNISHEIRTPLTLILGPLDDLLVRKNLPADVAKALEVIQRNGRKMLRLVNQLLDFRKVQNQKMNLRVRETNIIGFTHEIFENFQYLARQRNITYSFDAAVADFTLWFDREKLDIVLFNLLSNAFKFTPRERSIKVSVVIPVERSFAEIIIEDKGKGIPPEKMTMLFERFSSLSDDSMGFSGTGIGLALSRELVRLHGGDILVSSVPGEGSRFTVKLPAGNAHFQEGQLVLDDSRGVQAHHMEQIPTMEEAVQPLPERGEREHHLLVIEDNPEILNYITETFTDEFSISTATNGEEGLKVLKEVQPDLVITDVMMPVMDGITFTLKVKEDFDVSHIPVVMLTARSGINDQIDGIKSGAEAYVLKPFNARYLKAVVSGLIRQRELIFERVSAKKDLAPGQIRITSKDDLFLQNIMKIVDQHFSNPEFNVEKLVEYSAVGRTVFYNKIKGLTGHSPVEFLRLMRLRIAAQLLESSDYNVTEVAYMTGFNDEKYFRKCFKSAFGKTPSEYRNS